MVRDLGILLVLGVALSSVPTRATAQSINSELSTAAAATINPLWSQPGEPEGSSRNTVGNKPPFELDVPLATAIKRETLRLATTPQNGSADPEWGRVRRLQPGTEVTVTILGGQPARRIFVSAADLGITVLDVSDPELPAAAARALRAVASQHPEYLDGALRGGTFLSGDVRLSPAGIAAGDWMRSDLRHVVETIPRPTIAQLETRQTGRGFWGHLGPMGGWFLGGMSGGYVAGFGCQAMLGRSRCDTGAFLLGMSVGGVAAGIYGFHAALRETGKTIYRAP